MSLSGRAAFASNLNILNRNLLRPELIRGFQRLLEAPQGVLPAILIVLHVRPAVDPG